MPKPPNRRFVAAHRRQRIADLYVRGWAQAAIAEELGVSQATVSNDLKRIHAEWREAGVRDFDLAREIELRKLDRLEREAWAAWERSQKPAQSAVFTGEGAAQTSRKAVKNQNGDPRFLEIVSRCIAQRCALLGLDAPLQIADVSPRPSESHEERRARLAQIFETIKLASPVAVAALPAPETSPAEPAPCQDR